MKCMNCNLNEVDATIIIGDVTLHVCSPECMQHLITLNMLKNLKENKK